MSSTQTHNRTTDAIRTAYLATLANRPVLPPQDLDNAALIASKVMDRLREAYRLVKARPDMAEPLERAATSLKVVLNRIGEEQGKTRSFPSKSPSAGGVL